jgi:hypothetical protein
MGNYRDRRERGELLKRYREEFNINSKYVDELIDELLAPTGRKTVKQEC